MAIILHHPILHPQLSPDFDRMRSDGCALLKQRACSMFHIQATSSWLPKRLPEHTQEVFRGWPAFTTIIIHPSPVYFMLSLLKNFPLEFLSGLVTISVLNTTRSLEYSSLSLHNICTIMYIIVIQILLKFQTTILEYRIISQRKYSNTFSFEWLSL